MNEIIPEIREVRHNDLESLKQTLTNLTEFEHITQEQWDAYLDDVTSNPLHKVFVAEFDGNVVGTVTCIISRRLVPKVGFIAHIKDAVTSDKYTRRGIGERLMDHCIMYAKDIGAQEMFLDCPKNVVPFYCKKFHFEEIDNVCMRKNL